MKQLWVIAGCASLAACSQASSDAQTPTEPVVETASEDVAELSSETGADALEESASPVLADLASNAVACASEEEVIFSCTVESGKQLAVCAGDKGVEYRFGAGTPELTLTGGEWASVPYSGGGEAQIKFESGDTRYVVFSSIVRTNFKEGEPNYPAITDGVIVEKAGEVVAELACGGEGELMPVKVFAADRLLPKAPKLFINAER